MDPCEHKHAQRCLYTDGKWWWVCPECSYQWRTYTSVPLQRNFGFDLETEE